MVKYNGKISNLTDYYGVISFFENRKVGEVEEVEIERKIPFFFDNSSQFHIGDMVDFEISNNNGCNQLKIRSQNIKFAKNVIITQSNLQIDENSKSDFYQLLNSKISPSPVIIDETSLFQFLKTNNLRYSVFNEFAVLSEMINGTISISDFKKIIEIDNKFKEFIMRWVLFIEDNIKGRIENRFSELYITENDFIGKVRDSSNNNAKKLLEDKLNKLRKNYLLRAAGNLRLHYKTEADKIPKLEVAPFDMILDELTVGDLLVFIEFTITEYPDFISGSTTDWNKVYDFLSELKLIRNIAAHGNSFLSAILDKKNNPNYLLEENSKVFGNDPFYVDNSKEYSIFHLVRSSIKLTLKGSVANPQVIAVSWTQKLLNNQTLRSFFYFYFMVCYLTHNTTDKILFKNELRVIFGEYGKKIDFDKVVENVNLLPESDEKNQLLSRLIPQAINMFDYVKEHNYEYDETSGNTIYEILYRNRDVRINLGKNANWHLKMLLEITEKHPGEKAIWQSPECQEIRDKFGDFLKEGTNARQVLMEILDENLEQNFDNGIQQLLQIDEFKNLKFLFLDVLNLFS